MANSGGTEGSAPDAGDEENVTRGVRASRGMEEPPVGEDDAVTTVKSKELARLQHLDSVQRVVNDARRRILLLAAPVIAVLGLVGYDSLGSVADRAISEASKDLDDVTLKVFVAVARVGALADRADRTVQALEKGLEGAKKDRSDLVQQQQEFRSSLDEEQSKLAEDLEREQRKLAEEFDRERRELAEDVDRERRKVVKEVRQQFEAQVADLQTQLRELQEAATKEGAAQAQVVDAIRLRLLLSNIDEWDANTTTQGERMAAARLVESRTPGFSLRAEDPLEPFECGGAKHEVAVFVHTLTGLEFVLIPAGTFWMGSPATETGRHDHDEERHRVTLTQPFLLARTECTQAAWDRVGGDDARKSIGEELPIEMVSWNAVTAWCKKAGLRLPSEAEWEYACRAGTSTTYSFGNSASKFSEYGNLADAYAKSHATEIPYDTREWSFTMEIDDGHATAAKVGSYKPNAFGLFDMHGNVWEWCQDVYDERYPTGSVTDPVSTSGSDHRVDRGGSWGDGPSFQRSALRAGYAPGGREFSIGFRPARSVTP